MRIGGIHRVSLIDYPGMICAAVFTQGCNFKCPYCHNPALVDPYLYEKCIPEEELFAFLERRKGKLDAVSITGGEPTIQYDLMFFTNRVKNLGYAVKIDTNGSNPEVLQRLIDQRTVDYIAMDIKAPLKKYKSVANSAIEGENIKRSIDLIMSADIEYEFRTTVVKSLLAADDILEIGGMIRNARLYVLQQFVPRNTLVKQFVNEIGYSGNELETIRDRLMNDVQNVLVR